jgi:hypothetical protein
MIALLLTVLALALPFFVYVKYLVLKTTPLSTHHTEKPREIEVSPSGIDSEDLRQAQMKATPAAEPDNASTQVSLHGDRAVQPQSPATRRPAPAALPVDETTDITPHERRMLEAMNSSSSEHFQYIRQSMSTFLTSNASIWTSA